MFLNSMNNTQMQFVPNLRSGEIFTVKLGNLKRA